MCWILSSHTKILTFPWTQLIFFFFLNNCMPLNMLFQCLELILPFPTWQLRIFQVQLHVFHSVCTWTGIWWFWHVLWIILKELVHLYFLSKAFCSFKFGECLSCISIALCVHLIILLNSPFQIIFSDFYVCLITVETENCKPNQVIINSNLDGK